MNIFNTSNSYNETSDLEVVEEFRGSESKEAAEPNPVVYISRSYKSRNLNGDFKIERKLIKM